MYRRITSKCESKSVSDDQLEARSGNETEHPPQKTHKWNTKTHWHGLNAWQRARAKPLMDYQPCRVKAVYPDSHRSHILIKDEGNIIRLLESCGAAGWIDGIDLMQRRSNLPRCGVLAGRAD